MTQTELDLLMKHLDIAHHKLDHLAADLHKHMQMEEVTTQKIEKRLTTLEWKAHGIAVVFGALGALAWSKIKLLLGFDNPA